MFDNLTRGGARSSTSIDPRKIKEELDEKVRRLDPEACPLQLITDKLSRGPRPKSHKICVQQYDAFDHFDIASNFTAGTSGEARYARIRVANRSRVTTGNQMIYYPQDKITIPSTNQTVEVMITPLASKVVNGAELSLTTGLTGNTATRTAGTDIVVRNIEPQPIIPFTNTDIVYVGRTIHESQPIEASPIQRDCFYDYNWVEHKEAVVVFTEDQKEWVQTHGSVPDFTFQQREQIMEFKKSVEYSMFFGERAVNFEQAGRPTRHMRGLIPSIQTNVAVYNPDSISDFEVMFGNFLLHQGFRYNPNGKRKFAWAGAQFLQKFAMAFRDYRNIAFNKGQYSPGLNVDSYNILGMEILITRNEVFRLGTEMDHWCIIFDPQEAELRPVKTYESRPYALANERDYKWMIEWQGSIAWHREEVNAILRTN